MNPFLHGRPPRAALALAAAMALAGCAQFAPDGGLAPVQQLTRERIGRAPTAQLDDDQAEAARRRTRELLAQPLDADAAVELALLNNGDLQAALAELQIGDAERVRAGRLANPSWRFGRLGGGGTTEIDRGVMFDLLGLLTLPLASEQATRQLQQLQWQAAGQAIALAGETRAAWVDAVAAAQLVGYQAQVLQAAEASGELAQRMQAAGNFSRLAQLREQAFHTDAVAGMVRARLAAASARERLLRLMALPDDAPPVTLPERLPDLPETAPPLAPAEQAAIDHRLDVMAARRDTEATARALGLTKATRFVNVLSAGYQSQTTTGEPRRSGYEIEFELPLFDFGATRAAQAEATYRQALHRAAQVAVNARSEVREAHAASSAAYELARHYRDEVVPQRQRISEENLLRYNGMLISVFELLADAREQVAGVVGAVEALRDYWLAQARLQGALAGPAPSRMSSLAPEAAR